MRVPTSLFLTSLVLACTHRPATPPPAAAATPPGPGSPEAASQGRALAEEYFEGKLRLDPLLATQVGDSRYDDRLPDTLTDAGRAAIRELALKTRNALEAILRADLRGEDILTWAVLDEMTATTLEGLELDDHLMPLQQLDSLAVELPVLGSGVGTQRSRMARRGTRSWSASRPPPGWIHIGFTSWDSTRWRESAGRWTRFASPAASRGRRRSFSRRLPMIQTVR